jgi:frataxin-like iron-binding protein CyaY
MEFIMTESEFLTLADAVLTAIEVALERPDIVDAVDV